MMVTATTSNWANCVLLAHVPSAALQREKHAHTLTLTQSINTLDLYGEQLLFLFISNTAHPFTREIRVPIVPRRSGEEFMCALIASASWLRHPS